MAKVCKLLAFLVVAVMAVPGLAEETYTLNLSTVLTTDDPMYKGMEVFRDGVMKRTNNKVVVKIFPNSSLGNDEDVLEQARAGGGVAVLVDGGRLATYVKEFGILGAPYLAKDYKEMRKIVTSPLFDSWVEKLRNATGHQVLSFNWFQGERHLLTNKPVKVPADLSGIRMRTPGAPVWLETVRAMGATPTPMPWAEVYSALQLKAIDGAEAQLPAVFGQRLYEVIKYITKTSHFCLETGLVGSKAWFDKLPKDFQKIVKEEALKAGDFASDSTAASLASYEKQMKEKGVNFVELDTKPFRDATAVVYEKLGYTDLRKEVNKVLGR